MQSKRIEIEKKFHYALENIQKSLRFQIIILTVIGWGIAMAIDRTLVDDYRHKSDEISRESLPLMVRNKGDKIALSVLTVFETLLFGLGIGFFVAVGFKVFKIRNLMLRKRMVWCWACISFFMVSWWPHSTSHALILVSSGDPIDNLIAIEVSFHWTILFCSLTLSYFQYDLICLMFEVAMMKQRMETRKECNPLKMDWKYNFKNHGAVLCLLFFGFGMVFVFIYDPLQDSFKTYQKFFFVTFKIVDSVILGCGVAFSYIAFRIIKLLPSSNGKKVAIISSICIALLFYIGYGHPLAHTHAEYSMKSTVIIDYTIHLPIIILTSILAFYQFKMLELSTESSSSVCMAAKLRNRPHKYSFPIRSLGIKSQGVTNAMMSALQDHISSESKLTTTPEYDSSAGVTTEEKMVIHTQRRGTMPGFEAEIELEEIKKEFSQDEPVSIDIRADPNSISIDINNDKPDTFETVEINDNLTSGATNNSNNINGETVDNDNITNHIQLYITNDIIIAEDDEIIPTEETIEQII